MAWQTSHATDTSLHIFGGMVQLLVFCCLTEISRWREMFEQTDQCLLNLVTSVWNALKCINKCITKRKLDYFFGFKIFFCVLMAYDMYFGLDNRGCVISFVFLTRLLFFTNSFRSFKPHKYQMYHYDLYITLELLEYLFVIILIYHVTAIRILRLCTWEHIHFKQLSSHHILWCKILSINFWLLHPVCDLSEGFYINELL